jgi:hypothetical protein
MALAAALLAIAAISGCSTAQIDSIPKDFGGLPDSAPKRAENPPAYPAVHDMPAPRTATILDQEQQKRMESDLVAARNRQPGQEKNRLRDAQKKARDEAKAKEAKDKGKGKGKDSNKPQNTLARPPATVANAPAANPPAASPWPVPSR